MSEQQPSQTSPRERNGKLFAGIGFAVAAVILFICEAWTAPNYHACQNALVDAFNSTRCSQIAVLHQIFIWGTVACIVAAIIWLITWGHDE